MNYLCPFCGSKLKLFYKKTNKCYFIKLCCEVCEFSDEVNKCESISDGIESICFKHGIYKKIGLRTPLKFNSDKLIKETKNYENDWVIELFCYKTPTLHNRPGWLIKNLNKKRRFWVEINDIVLKSEAEEIK